MFFVGGDNSHRLWKWTDGMAGWQQLVPGGGANKAIRFFVNPNLPRTVYLLDEQHVMRSDDGGVTWSLDASLEQQLTCGGRIPAGRGEDDDGQGDHYDVVLSDMQFDPFNPQRRFAVGLGGAFMTADGVNWERLLDTGALRGRPANCYFDWVSDPSDPALYVSFAGRSIVKISGFASRDARRPTVALHDTTRETPTDHARKTPDTRQPRVNTADGQTGFTQPMPDDRVLITLDDGRSFVIDAEQLKRQGDGTYLI